MKVFCIPYRCICIYLIDARNGNFQGGTLMMRTAIYLSGVLLVFGVILARSTGALGNGRRDHTGASFHRPELEYLKAVNSVAPPQDPQLLFLLMGEYSNANLQGEGAEFFSARLNQFGPHLTDTQKALYLSAIGLLRAQHASLRFTVASNRLRERHDCHARKSQTTFRGASFCCELDCRARLHRTSRLLPSKVGSEGRADLVFGQRRQSPA